MPHADPPLAGRFVVLEPLGAGATGTVRRAWDLREQRFVALKLVHPAPSETARSLGSADLALRLVREQALRLVHPHVAAPTGWVAVDDRVAVVSELVRGGTLADLLAERGGQPVGAAYVGELLGQLLDGLAAVHAAGLVHRDVKPANVLLEPTGRGRPHLRLGDLGLAVPVGAPGSAVGTPAYAAPEQLAGAPADPRQDLHAVGVTVRRLLGRVPSALDGLVAALVDPDPDRRPASADEARHGLDALALPRPLRRPRVPDRVGAVTLTVPAADRRGSAPGRTAPGGPAWAPLAAFAASATTTVTTGWVLLRP